VLVAYKYFISRLETL